MKCDPSSSLCLALWSISIPLLVVAIGCVYYSLTPARFLTRLIRVFATHILSLFYTSDLRDMEDIISRYKVGVARNSLIDSTQTWRKLESMLPGFKLLDITPINTPNMKISFVYETADAAHLIRFRETYALESLIQGATSQYDAMLKLGAWIGTRWDHGTDPLVGSRYACDPTGLVAAGEQGAKYWCEIASRITVQAATSLKWPARVVTASRDGYTWEHGVAELWSDDFGKWFTMDTDFNIVYESNGIPLSSFELTHEGPDLLKEGKLVIRAIAPPKPSLTLNGADMIEYYRYIHVDLRNDWCTRQLRRGSPVGSDLATWWTARPDMPPILTAKKRVNDADNFDWKTLNTVIISVVNACLLSDGRLRLEVAFSAESPVFSHFEISLNDNPWESVKGSAVSLVLDAGDNSISARMITATGSAGRVMRVAFRTQK